MKFRREYPWLREIIMLKTQEVYIKHEVESAKESGKEGKYLIFTLNAAAIILLVVSLYLLVGEIFGLTTETRKYIKNAALSISESEKDIKTEQKIEFLCDALSSTGRAIARDPYNGRYLMAWAHLRSLLETTDCSKPYTTGDSNLALEKSLSLSPLDPEVLISGAQLFAIQGKERESWALINRALLFDQHLDANERSSIASLIRSTDAVQATIPAQFPQVVVWSRYLLDSASPPIRGLVPSLQQKALVDLQKDIDTKKVPNSIARAHLTNLYNLDIEDSVRQLADSIAAEIYRTENIWNVYRYVDYRKKLSSIPHLVGFKSNDTNPEHSSLTYWGNPVRLTITNPKVSLGFVMKDPEAIRFLELELHSGSKPIPLNLLKVYISNDNITWQEIGLSGSPLVAKLGDKLLQGFTLPDGVKSRYWKITYHGDNKSPAAVQLPDGVKVYTQRGSDESK